MGWKTEDVTDDSSATIYQLYSSNDALMMSYLVVTENGYGKKTPIDEYRITNRGGKGVKTLNITDKNGSITSFKTVDNSKDLIIITNEGIIIRLAVDKISEMSRVTQGVRLINLRESQFVSTVAIIDKNEEVDSSNLGDLSTESNGE